MLFFSGMQHALMRPYLLFLMVSLITICTVPFVGVSGACAASHEDVVVALRNGDDAKALDLITEGPKSLWLVTLRSFKEVAEPKRNFTMADDDLMAVYPLLAAVAATGKTSVAEALIERGAKVDHRLRGEKSTALMFAAKMHHLETVQLLLDNGANPALLTAGKRPASALSLSLEHMESGDQERVALALLESPHGPQTLKQLTPLQVRVILETASYNGLLQVMQRLAELRAPLGGRNRLGATLLHYALMGAAEGGESVAIFLVRQGLDPNQPYATDQMVQMAQAEGSLADQHREGKTPLLIGIDEGVSARFVDEFIQLGANPNARSLGQVSPIQAARNKGRNDIVEVLKTHGAR